jgi:hypothetical protein
VKKSEVLQVDTVATDAEGQLSLLKQVVKLFWNVSPSDEANLSVRLAVELALCKTNDSNQDNTSTLEGDGAALPSSNKLSWPELNLGFWLHLEQILTDSCGIALQNNNKLASWFVSVVQSRPALLISEQQADLSRARIDNPAS